MRVAASRWALDRSGFLPNRPSKRLSPSSSAGLQEMAPAPPRHRPQHGLTRRQPLHRQKFVCYNTKVLDEHLPIAFDVLSDMVLRPAFRADDIEKEKGVILEELKMEVDNPEYLVHETFSSNFFRGHPLGQSIIGTRQTIRSFDTKMVSDFYRSVSRR
jgi:hypothetical protein